MPVEPTTTPKPFALVVMPFDPSFKDIYELGIKETCIQAGAYCERIDEQIFHESIMDRLYNQISKADMIIADMTGRNPNVFYEVGYAHALGKRTILLTQNADDIPFDLKHYPHVVYEGKITELREKLKPRIEWCVANPPEKSGAGTIGIELYLGDKNLAIGNVVHCIEKHRNFDADISVYNASPRSFVSGSFKIGVLTSLRYTQCIWPTQFNAIELPTRQMLHMFSDFDTLFPQEFTALSFRLDDSPTEEAETILFRVFTDNGSRDYPLIIQAKEK